MCVTNQSQMWRSTNHRCDVQPITDVIFNQSQMWCSTNHRCDVQPITDVKTFTLSKLHMSSNRKNRLAKGFATRSKKFCVTSYLRKTIVTIVTLCSFHRFVLLVCLRVCVAGLAMNEIVLCWPVTDLVHFHRYVWQDLEGDCCRWILSNNHIILT